MRNKVEYLCPVLACLTLFAAPLVRGDVTVRLGSSVSSPQPVGARIKLTATATDTNSNPMTYRFEVAANGSSTYQLLQDFSTANNFTWVESYVEGSYIIRVTARDYLSGETAQATQQFYITSLVIGGVPVVTATAHPLVALLSAPTCPIGSTASVQFKRFGAKVVANTDFRPCHAGSMNFYVAGLVPSTKYTLTYQVNTNGTVVNVGDTLSFTTGAIPSNVKLPAPVVNVPPSSATAQAYKLSLSSYAAPTLPFAADLEGEIVWYSPFQGQLVRTYGETLIMNTTGPGTGTGFYGVQTRQQVLREFDLAGNVVRQTCADRVSEQLVAMGTDPLGRFNHDAVRLPNGHTIALADAQRSFPAGTQGSSKPIDIIGEIIVELDENFQVVWFWNAFDHAGGGTQLDINRPAVQNETCAYGKNGAPVLGCPPALLPGFRSAADWLHANAVQLLADGNLMLSLRNQDWVIKINYENGAVMNGPLLWRMGRQGDFTILSSDSYPWFSGQHEPGFSSPTSLALFDNGNLRHATQNGGNSRGMAFTVDEGHMTVTTTTSADLGVYSSSQGSAQLLPNGDYQFQPGRVDAGMESMEVTPNAPNVTTFEMSTAANSYRTFRMPDMYTPPYGTASYTPGTR